MTRKFIKDISVRVRKLIDLQDRPHNDLTDRDAPDSHPASAITGLSAPQIKINANYTNLLIGETRKADGTTYTNNNPYPIIVYYTDDYYAPIVTVNGTPIFSNTSGYNVDTTFLVPSGANYSIAAGLTAISWYEWGIGINI